MPLSLDLLNARLAQPNLIESVPLPGGNRLRFYANGLGEYFIELRDPVTDTTERKFEGSDLPAAVAEFNRLCEVMR